MPKYGHIVFDWLLGQFLSDFDKTLYVFRRPVATSRAPHCFEHVKVVWQNWAKNWQNKGVAVPRAPVGTQSPEPRQKIGISLLVNCYLEIKFHNQKTGWTPPPPPPPPPSTPNKWARCLIQIWISEVVAKLISKFVGTMIYYTSNLVS